MPALTNPPPFSPVEPVTEVLHGVSVTDPYRWLEDQESPRTRAWISEQTRYARSYLDSIPGRERIRARIRELLDVETYDSLQKVANRYFFRKRRVGQEQFCICMREGVDGSDEVLVDPALRGTGPHTALRPLRISPDGRLMLYEVKQGGERTGRFELLDIQDRTVLADSLPRGHLRGFAFDPDNSAFYYVHESLETSRPCYRAAYRHVLGTDAHDDVVIFFAGEDLRIRLSLISDIEHLGFLVNRFQDIPLTDFHVRRFQGTSTVEPIIQGASYLFEPRLQHGRILAMTDHESPNLRIVEAFQGPATPFRDIVPETTAVIQEWAIIGSRIFVSYLKNLLTATSVFDLSGRELGQVPLCSDDTIHFPANDTLQDEFLFERESFLKPIEICRYSSAGGPPSVWARRSVPFNDSEMCCFRTSYFSKDGQEIPVTLVGHRDVMEAKNHPTIMNAYGGFGVSTTPQFSVLVASLLERGCRFALPNIRGGAEFGAGWHKAAKRRRRQVAIDDFISAAEWLIHTGQTEPRHLGIFGGSNAGLLVGAAITQRPDLFCAALCMFPLLDMLRYHLFDNSFVWRDEFGTAEDADDSSALHKYSPYHNVRDGTSYPAIMIVSGDLDQSCNPLHARKMTARLQSASDSGRPILLDYTQYRGHSPVQPLSCRIEGLSDRVAFLCDQLCVPV
ncbi:MAG: S9 family peptidase [Acidobacteria bacterium]|nr:S9 family peptidase [Acidobacteriota bacterium]